MRFTDTRTEKNLRTEYKRWIWSHEDKWSEKFKTRKWEDRYWEIED